MRDRLIELICDKIQDGHCIGYCNHPPCSQCKDIADYLLANGVIVQKQSEWENTKEPLGWQDVDCVECSACHETWILDEDFDFEFCKEVWKYCPNCGAKIKEREGK